MFTYNFIYQVAFSLSENTSPTQNRPILYFLNSIWSPNLANLRLNEANIQINFNPNPKQIKGNNGNLEKVEKKHYNASKLGSYTM